MTIKPNPLVYVWNLEGKEIETIQKTTKRVFPKGLYLDEKNIYVCGLSRNKVDILSKDEKRCIRRLDCEGDPIDTLVWEDSIFVLTDKGLRRFKKEGKKDEKPTIVNKEKGFKSLALYRNCLYLLKEQKIAFLSKDQAFSSDMQTLTFNYCQAHPVRNILTYLSPLNDILESVADNIPVVGAVIKPLTKLFDAAITQCKEEKDRVERLNKLIKELAVLLTTFKILELEYEFPEIFKKTMKQMEDYATTKVITDIEQVDSVYLKVQNWQTTINAFLNLLAIAKERRKLDTNEIDKIYDRSKKEVKYLKELDINKIEKFLTDFQLVSLCADSKTRIEIKTKSVFFASVFGFLSIMFRLPEDTIRPPELYYPNFYYQHWKELKREPEMEKWGQADGWDRLSPLIRQEYEAGLGRYDAYLNKVKKANEEAPNKYTVPKDFKPPEPDKY